MTDKNLNEERLTVAVYVGDMNEVELFVESQLTNQALTGVRRIIISEKSIELMELWHFENSVASKGVLTPWGL